MRKNLLQFITSAIIIYIPLLTILTLFSFINLGCSSEGSVQDPDGRYSANIIFSPATNFNTTTTSVGPQAQRGIGTAEVTRSGDLFSVYIESDLLSIGFSGNIIANDMNTTVVDTSGDTVTINLTFGDKRTDFSGTITFTTGTYTLTSRKF